MRIKKKMIREVREDACAIGGCICVRKLIGEDVEDWARRNRKRGYGQLHSEATYRANRQEQTRKPGQDQLIDESEWMRTMRTEHQCTRKRPDNDNTACRQCRDLLTGTMLAVSLIPNIRLSGARGSSSIGFQLSFD